VLPFANLSGDPHEDIFIDGLTDNLINSLSRLPTLFVIARTSTFAYKGKATKAREISRELGVKYLLEGSVSKAGDRIRVNTQLVDGASGDQLWAESYDRPLGEIFALQDEIIKKIVTTLKLQLNLWERGDFSAKAHGTRNQEAYNFLLRASGYHFSFTREGNTKVREMAEKAVALDPDYADAYMVLGWTYCYDWTYQWTNDSRALASASEMAKRAVAADDANSGAHVLLGYTYMLSGRFRDAFAENRRAIALDPNSTVAYAMDALDLAVSGRPAEAVAAAEMAMRLDPHNHAVDQLTLGYVYVYAERYTEAAALLEQHLARNSNDLVGHMYLAIAYSEIGRNTGARAHIKEALRINPDYSLSVLKHRMPPMDAALAQRWFADLSRSGLK
jgi:adenylate cyclase